MNTVYKVIKDKGALKAGDILTLDGDMYTCTSEVNDDDCYSKMTILLSPAVVEKYFKQGYIVAKDADVEECKCCECDKLIKLKQFLSSLKNTYNQRKASIDKKDKEGKVQPCVKLEHDTVYYNLMKLINKIEQIINE